LAGGGYGESTRLAGHNLLLPGGWLQLGFIRVKTSFDIDLAGEWIGHYPGHFDEVIRIAQVGDQVEAVKITGDDYVPAGATTWRASLRTFQGEGQIAEEEFNHPRFIPGRLIIVNPERIIFRWENCGEVEFRRDE